MARIDISKMEKTRNTVHDEVVATYDVFTYNGIQYLQIDTYGRSDREYVEKSSQIIQLDKESALNLVKLINKIF